MKEPVRIKLIAGLGNPGREYAGTRHNAGFEVIEKILPRLPGRFAESHVCSSRCFAGRFRGRELILLMPQTFMNLSGKAVAPLARRLGIAPEEILIIYDDLDLPVGRIRIRQGGSAGGHHGVESVMAELGTADFSRLRIGIGGERDGSTVDYVLSPISAEKQADYSESLEAAAEAAVSVAAIGANRAMNRFNAWIPSSQQPEKNENNHKTGPDSAESEPNRG